MQYLVGFLFIIGMALAGSDAPAHIWPWNVLSGAILFGLAVILSNFKFKS